MGDALAGPHDVEALVGKPGALVVALEDRDAFLEPAPVHEAACMANLLRGDVDPDDGRSPFGGEPDGGSPHAAPRVQHPVAGADGDGVRHDLVGADQRVGVVACPLVPVAEVHAQVLAVDPEEPVVQPALPIVACDGLLMVVQLDLGNLFHGAPLRSSSPADVCGDRSGAVILARGPGLRPPMHEAGPGGTGPASAGGWDGGDQGPVLEVGSAPWLE